MIVFLLTLSGILLAENSFVIHGKKKDNHIYLMYYSFWRQFILSLGRQNKLSPKRRKFFPNKIKRFSEKLNLNPLEKRAIICQIKYASPLFPRTRKLFSSNKIPLRIN